MGHGIASIIQIVMQQATVIGVMLLVLSVGALRAQPPSTDAQRSYQFADGKVSRQVLENYLSRAITQAEFLSTEGCYNDGPYPYKADDVRMLKSIGAKFIGRAIYSWGKENFYLMPSFWTGAQQTMESLHAFDSTMLFQACIFEIITEKVENIAIPAWVFETFGHPVQQRHFRYADMLNENGRFVDHWRKGSSVPDITRQETQLFFYYLARRYLEIGIEAIHFGQAQLMAMEGAESMRAWRTLLGHVREAAKTAARRGTVICDSHLPNGGMVVDGQLLFDFVSFPLRLREIVDKPQAVELQVGYYDGIYLKTVGGTTPSGWYCDRSPYLVEFDNFGISRHRDEPNLDDHYAWGYDEITWFHKQPEAYRNRFLWYAHDWVRKTDPYGFLQMPGSRIITGADTNRYRANSYGPENPLGKNQENT